MKNIFRQLFVLVILGCCTPGIFAEDVKLFEETATDDKSQNWARMPRKSHISCKTENGVLIFNHTSLNTISHVTVICLESGEIWEGIISNSCNTLAYTSDHGTYTILYETIDNHIFIGEITQ